ncbi:hypothetical protein GOBAR_AA18168 [Gossypium barbadense]|uniref:DUF547 domain-containing protein n=1 Tax=Gossypium barbadense TaxID=3634 RepID=A0A2P5XGN4_GOSBA|nr:hypothetical protein GOBAR_AA18168 [Gossypium barbadense]
MGFQGSGESKMLGLIVTSSRHKRSKSFPGKKRVEEDGFGSSVEESNRMKLDTGHLKDSVKTKKKQSPTSSAEVKSSLKQEILELEERLQDQFEVRRALETALGYRTSSNYDTSEAPVSKSKPATELVKEIAVLELEVVYLEHYLLSLYRKAFDQQVSSLSPSKRDERLKTSVDTPKMRFSEVSRPGNESKVENSAILSDNHDNSWEEPNGIGEEKLLDSSVGLLWMRLAKAIRACHSQPLSMMEYAQNAPNIISLAEHLGTRISDHVPETPNKLSEDMIKCMSAIYCKLTDPPLVQNSFSAPNSPMSSVNSFSPQDHHEMWSPGFRNNSSFDVRLDNPFHVEGLKEFSGPYSTMVEVPWIFRDSQKLGDVEHLLQNFRSTCPGRDWTAKSWNPELICTDGVTTKEICSCCLPFLGSITGFIWLMVFHKTMCEMTSTTAAYNIGGHTISADTIQNSILGCRMSRPGQWLRLLLPSRAKFKPGDKRQAYAIEHPVPLLHFALCAGNHSDPSIRAYTPKRVFQELETAKEEYIWATFGVRKDKKILLPKIVESFAKDSNLCTTGVIKMVQQSLPESLHRSIRKCEQGKSHKGIEWIPHNFTFRYLISKELVR